MQGTEATRNTLNFCLAYLLSAFGYEFIFFVMTLHIYNISHSAVSVGIFTALTFFPRLFASFFGAVTDRYRRDKVLAAATGAVGCLIFIMARDLPITWLYAVWFFVAVKLTLIANVRTALMTEIMTQDNYLWGNSAVMVSLNLAKILGPFLGGVITTYYSWQLLMYFTAGVYCMAMVFALLVKLPAQTRRADRKNVLQIVKEGLMFIRRDAILQYLLSVAFFYRLFLGLQVSLFVVYIKAYLLGNDTDYGFFMGIIGIGSILGSVAGPWLAKRISYLRLITWGMSLHYASFLILGICDSYSVAMATMFVSFGVFYASVVGVHSLRDIVTPLSIRGRVYGSVTALLTPAAIASMVCGGYLANTLGVEKVMMGGGILALVSLYATGAAVRPDAVFTGNNRNQKIGGIQ